MAIASAYHFEGLTRYGYGWENPNYAGAVIATVIPLTWATAALLTRNSRLRRWRWTVWAVEIALTLMLATTYSRGGAVAWLAAWCFYFGVRASVGPRPAWPRWRGALGRLAALSVIVGSVGLARRLAESSGDASVGNRLRLWKGGLELIAGSPWWGWGKGNSGLAYLHWVQAPSDARLYYNGMVNSYLHVFVEYGIPRALGLCAILLLPVTAAFIGRRDTSARGVFRLGAAAGIVAFSAAAFFSTVWTNWSVVGWPLALGVVVGICTWAGPARAIGGRSVRYTAVGLAGAGIAVYCAAAAYSARQAWPVRVERDGAIVLSNHRRARGPVATILCDGRVLGPYYGRSIRAALTGTESRFGRVVVYPPDIHPRSLTLAGDVVAMGSRANEVVALATGARVILVLPAVAAPAVDLPSVRRVALPEFDQLGFARGWLQWCDTYGHAATVLPDLGQDGRSAFAALVAELGPDPKR